MSHFVTQCPHCQTSFRVSHAQLTAARGVVRCGACQELFNAARALQGDGDETAMASADPVTPHDPELPAATAPLSRRDDRFSNSPDTLWIHDELDLDNLDLDEELAKLERQERAFSRAPLGLEPDPSPAVVEAMVQQVVDEPDHATEPAAVKQDLQPARVDIIDSGDGYMRLTPVSAEQRTRPSPLTARHEPMIQPSDTAHRIEPSLDTLAQPDEPQPRVSPIDTFDEKDHEQSQRPGNEGADPLFDLEDEPLQLEWEARRRPWGRWLGWGLLNLIALLALAAQYVAYNFDALSRQDEYRPWLERICPAVGCELPPRVDISLIKSSNLVVRSHPDFAGALTLDAMIYNRAPFAQPFPLLEVRFDDMQGNTMARRTFKPGEYLAGELAGTREMPSQIPIHISLDILDPGANAVNYSLGFRSPD